MDTSGMATAPIPNASRLSPAVPPRFTGRIQSLDGLRALSILLVLVGHLEGTKNFSPRFSQWFGDYANFGVRVFFVISGFLITRLLMEEYAKTQTISLYNFYARRTLRIFPAFFAYIGVIALATFLGFIYVTGTDYAYALTYTMNYYPERGWYLGHLWSLSVEEQFYLLWPFAFVALGPSRAMKAAAVVLALGPVSRLLVRILLQHSPYREAEIFPVVADSLAAGCLLAGVRDQLWNQPAYNRILRSHFLLIALPIFFITINGLRGYTAVRILGDSALNLAIAVMIDRFVSFPNDTAGRLMNVAPLAWIGVLSYSLYLWQQPFLNRASDSWFTAFPVNILFAGMCACASYYLLERPLVRLRQRFR
jgi:peptidoglycan/LPS O-acetylase OafA/YrhL